VSADRKPKRVRQALASSDAEKKRLAALDTQLDPMIGRRTRMGAGIMFGFMWASMPLLTGKMLELYPSFPRHHMYWWTGAVLVAAGGVVFWGRESLMKTQVNRRFIAACTIMFASQFVLEIGSNLMNLPVLTTAVLHIAVWFMAMCVACVFIEKKLWVSTIAMMVAFFYACANPTHVWWAMCFVNVVLMANFSVAWRQPAEDRAYRNRVIRDQLDAVQRRLR
jgi:hypothetical protein